MCGNLAFVSVIRRLVWIIKKNVSFDQNAFIFVAAGDSDDDEVVAIEGVDVDEEGDGVADEVPRTARAVLRITFPWKSYISNQF